jgi:hypothetical protein
MTNVVRLPVRGRWAWDSRGANRAVRVSPHPGENVVNLSVWRDDVCVGTVRLMPAEVTALVTGLTEGLAELTERPAGNPARVRDLEQRLARVEARLAEPAWRRAAGRAARSIGDALDARRAGGPGS